MWSAACAAAAASALSLARSRVGSRGPAQHVDLVVCLGDDGLCHCTQLDFTSVHAEVLHGSCTHARDQEPFQLAERPSLPSPSSIQPAQHFFLRVHSLWLYNTVHSNLKQEP